MIFNYVYETPVKLSVLLYLDFCVQIYVHKRSHESEFKVNLTIVVLNSENLYCPCAGILQDDTIRRAYGLHCV